MGIEEGFKGACPLLNEAINQKAVKDLDQELIELIIKAQVEELQSKEEQPTRKR